MVCGILVASSLFRVQSSLSTRSIEALLAVMRSFEIMSEPDRLSRYWRLRLNGVSFL